MNGITLVHPLLSDAQRRGWRVSVYFHNVYGWIAEATHGMRSANVRGQTRDGAAARLAATLEQMDAPEPPTAA